MMIDNFYNVIDKSNFYLGMISQVYEKNSYVQVENLTLLNHRNIRLESLVPNTINYFVIIDSVQGLFIGKVYQSKVNSSNSIHNSINIGKTENIYPELTVDVIGLLDDNKFKLAGFKTVGITDKVYIANQELIKRYLNSIEINEYPITDANGEIKKDDQGNKIYQKRLDSLAKISGFDNEYLSLKPNTLFDRHLMAVGTTNSGKSTSSLSILNKMILSGNKVLIIDPTGEYKDSFTNEEAVRITLGENAFLATESVDDSFWIDFFNVSSSEDSNKAAVLSDAISSLRYQSNNNNDFPLIKDGAKVSDLLPRISEITTNQFNLNLLVEQIKNEAVKQVLASGHYHYQRDGNLYNASIWLMQKVAYFMNSSLISDFFDDTQTENNLFCKLDDFIHLENKKSLYIDTSNISKTNSSGKTITDLITKYILDNKTSEDAFILFIDEVHRYINKWDENCGLVSLAREGRKKGIFLFLTTQNPKDVPAVLLGQVGTFIIHRLTHSEELQTIQNLVQSNTISKVRKLNQGEAILISINLLQDVHIYFEKSTRVHINDTPKLS